MPGIGAEMGLADHLSLRLQYTFTIYGSCDHDAMKTGTVSDGMFTYPYEINMHTKLDPTRGTLQLMLSYLFN